MVDKDLFERIADAACTTAELADFCVGLSERELDRDASFEKYYSLGRILSAIEKCERGEIDVDYLSMWATAYNWIVMATDWSDGGSTGIFGFEDYLTDEISDTLDALSFLSAAYKKEECGEQLANYKETFRLLDLFLSTRKEWTIFCASGVGADGPTDDLHMSFLAVNESKKLFDRFFWFGYLFDGMKNKEQKITPEEMEERVAALKEAGYKEPSL